MNCPTCGAENEADAHFCAECGTPLENQDIEATIAGQILIDADNDMTIMSTPEQLAAEQAKTVAVDHSQVADMLPPEEDGDKDSIPSGVEVEPPLPPPSAPVDVPPAADDGGDGGPVVGAVVSDDDKGGSNKTMIIVGVVVAVLLLCCCCSSFGVGVLAALEDPDLLEDFISFVPSYLPFV